MQPVMNHTHKPPTTFFRFSIRTFWQLLTIGLIAASVPLALYVRVKSAGYVALNVASAKDSKERVIVQAAGRGKPYLNLKDGRQMTVAYRGASGVVNALQTGTASSRTLAAADLDGDGAPDLVVGYTNGGTGIVTVQKGNPEGFAPKDDSVFQRMQQGYNPPSLLPTVETYQVSSPVDFLRLGDFNGDGRRDVLIASRDGNLRLLPGDGQGGLGAEQEISLPGTVTALTTGEFRAADGRLDIAVGINGPEGAEVLVFDGAAGGFESEPFHFPVAARAVSVEFGELDSDPFMDLAIADGSEINIVHGWGRKVTADPHRQVERIPLGYAAQTIAVDNFTWDRQGTREIAVLADDGSVRMLENSRSDKRPLTPADIRARAEARGKITNRNADVEVVRGWTSESPGRWSEVNQLPLNARATTNAAAQGLLTHGKISTGETNALMVVNGAQRKLEVAHQVSNKEAAVTETSTGDISTTSLDVTGTPVAMLALPKKLNGTRDMIVLTAESPTAVDISIEPLATFSVNTTSDHAPDGACNVSPDCTLREAVIAANAGAGADTISLPAGTYTLTIIGNTNNMGAGEGFTGNASIGDLDFRDANGDATTVMGAGAATTFIVQSTANDRTLEPNPTALLNFDWTISGVTIAGGRDTGGSTTGGGGAMLSGSKDNTTTITNCVIANNRASGAGTTGGGGVSNQGGTVTITNTVFGGAVTVAACPSQTATNCGNSSGPSSGGGIGYSPGDPLGRTPSAGTLTIQTTSSFQNNTANSLTAGGAGADLYTHNLGTGSVSISGTTFTSNAATGTASGGGIIIESIGTTISTTSFTNNSAGNRGGGIQVAGGSLLLDGTSPSITFSGNTATTAGSSISASSAVNLSGTNTTIGGDLEITTNGVWTNNVGSTMSPNNLIIIGTGSFTANNSTTNVSGNFQFQSGTFNAGTGLFNFNGTGSQTINNSAAITFNNLTDSNVNNPLTINNNIAVNGTLNVNGANAILAPLAGTIISGPGTLTGTGTARVTRTAATPDFLSQYTITNKTLTNLTIDYNGAGNQTVNNTPAYSHLQISGTGTKTLQGNTSITGNLTIAAAALDVSASNFSFSLGGNWTNNVGTTGFVARSGNVNFAGSSGIQTLTGNTTFFNLTLNNSGATTNFGNTSTTIGNDLVATAGTMDGGTSTMIFTGTGDNAGSIGGANPKNFFNLQINSPATISNTTGGNITIENNYINNGTFNQAAAVTTIFDLDNSLDGAHTLSGAGSTTFGNFTINTGNTVDAGTHNFNVVGAVFNVIGTFTGNASTVSFIGTGAQGILGNGTKNFAGLLINNPVNVNVSNGAGAVDASVGGLLTLTTDLTVAAGAVLQQSGTSAGAADAIGTVRRTDLGVTERSFGNLNNSITINSGTPPTQMDFNLVKAAPGTFPATVKVVPRDITLTPTGGSGISATVKLRYIDPGELTGPGITESRLILWKNISTVWTPQGGTPNLGSNFVSLPGVSSFSEWAIAEGSDLTLSKANNVSGSAVTGQSWNWTLTATNTGAPATFTAGQTILSDNLPNSNLNYGTPTVQNVSNITGNANISCSIVSSDLTCTANGGSVTFDSNLGVSKFDVVFSATPQAAGTYQNPRTGGGIAQIDPNNLIAESNETNNSPTTNTVTVGKANTTTTISNAASLTATPSVTGQPVTVTWSVTVNAPGALGAALTGNVTVSDGTNSCFAAVSAGQCDVTFTSAGAKSLTATYAGDTNYNGSASSPATAHTVNKADTTTTITSDLPDPSNIGQAVTVNYTVTANAPGGGTPTGNVVVTVSGGAETCNSSVATGTCMLTLTAGGTRTITATYQGDSNYNTSFDTESHAACQTSPVVTSTADSGAGTLRDALANVCDGGTITFDTAGTFSTPQTITLASELTIGTNVTVDGPDLLSQQVTINGGNSTFRLFTLQSGKTATIRDLKLTGGNVAAGNGGAILNDHGTLTLINLDITGNNASSGGGVYNDATTSGGATLNVINCTIRNNTAAGGGGLYSNANGGGTATLNLTNSTLSGNNATGSGGGLYTDATGGAANLAITNCTITNNRADSDTNASGTGGGVFVAGDSIVILRNSIVDLNFVGGSGSVGDDIQNSLDNANSTHNLVGVCTACGLTNGVNNNQLNVSSGSLNIGALTLNGGTVPTHALLSGSVAIEAGNNAYVVAPPFLNVVPITDERGTGFPRIVDGDLNATATVDIGAYEAPPPPPTVSSIVRANSNPTNAASVDFTVTFSQNVTGVDSSDFALTTTGVSGASITNVTGSNNTRTVTVNTGSGDGTIRLDVVDDDTIIDANSQPLGGPGVGNGNFTSGEVYTVDKTSPTVSSIVRADANPTGAASVNFTVTFSESVTGVDSSDFALVTAGVAGASITNVTGSGTTRTVTVNTGTGSGTIGLNLTDDDTIVDAATNKLGGTGAGNGNFTGQVYTIDKTAPTVTSIVRADANPTAAASVNFTVTFSESVTGVDTSDFTLTTTGSVTGASVTLVSGSGATRTVTVNTGSNDGTIRLDVADNDSIVDQANNPLGGTGAGNGNFTTGEFYTIDKVNPTVSSIVRAAANPTNAASVTFTVTFSENVTGVDASDFALATTGVAGASITNVTGSNTTYTVTVGTGTGDGTIGLNLVDNDSILDIGSKPLGGVGVGNGNFTGQVYTIDKTAPTVTINQAAGQSDPSSGSTINFTAVFSEAVTGFTNTDVTFSGAGSTTAAVTEIAPNNGTTYNVAITGMNTPGTVTATVNVNAAQDAAGNTSAASTSSDNSVNWILCTNNPVVTTNTDSGAGSLRQAIIDACDGSTITFNMGLVVNPITLTSGELLIDKNLTITGPGANVLVVQRNAASGPFRIFNIQAGKTVTISGLTITNGNLGGDGAGLLNNGTLTLTNCSVTGNTSSGNGGGISNASGTAALTITGSTIAGNSAPAGGGVVNAGTLTLINSTVSGNTGDGLSNLNGATANLTNDTFSNNSVRGISSNAGATTNIRNTIVANTPAAGDVNGIFNSQGNNLIGKSDGSTGFTNGVNGDKVGTVASPLNALLAALSNYGGPTQTHALLPGSPAIDSANNCVTDVAHCGDANIPQLTTDQRGLARQVNGTVDIGAFESRGFTIAATSGTPQSTAILTAFGAPLVATVTSAFSEPVNGGQVTFTAPGSGASATFTGGVTTINATIGSGQASVSATANGIAGGPYNVTASGIGVSGTANFSLTNLKAATTTAVASSVNPSDFGQTVTFTATVTSGAGTPTGSVQFKDGGGNLGGPVALNGSGVATLTTSSLTAGTHTITVDYLGDANFNTSTGTLAGGQVVKPQPSLSINDVSTTEGQAGTKVLNFTVTLSAASSLTVTVNFATANGTATAGSDYVAIPATLLTFNPGDTTKTIPVTINGDIDFEADETFTVNLSGATNATISKAAGAGTIQNDDAQGGFISFSAANYNVNENAGFITVTITRTNDVSQAANVDYATDDTGASINCAALNTGLASQRCDYTSLFGTLKFAANETQKTIDIPINLDGYTEGPETFMVKLSNPTGGAILSAPFNATVTINDSASPTPNAIDDTETFVRQQYRDFLNRDADPSGLAFWKNNIDKCNDPAQRPPGQTLQACIEVQRITTSAAFFLSIEFRQTGGMVRDFYVASLNRPLTNNMPDFVEFMRDTQAIQKGVIVLQPGWELVLAANGLAFRNEFVMRGEFVALYPTTDTPTQYVDKLYLHAAVAPANPAERAAAIAEFGAAPTASDPAARARALLDITLNPQFQAREINRAFVHMQYLGYLRRNPNDTPDNNFDGYNFWLNKLILFNGDFLQSEMVKAFLTSLEYRKRFGP